VNRLEVEPQPDTIQPIRVEVEPQPDTIQRIYGEFLGGETNVDRLIERAQAFGFVLDGRIRREKTKRANLSTWLLLRSGES
jgi:hypothetical protein